MSFSVPIKRIAGIERHPNAGAIEIAVIDGYRSIVKKGEFQKGGLVAYIPEGAVLPKWLLQRIGFWDAEKGCGKLRGKDGNCVKAIRLRGELSQGICYPVDHELQTEFAHTFFGFDGARQLQDGDDVASILGIIKYEPRVPVAMTDEIFDETR